MKCLKVFLNSASAQLLECGDLSPLLRAKYKKRQDIASESVSKLGISKNLKLLRSEGCEKSPHSKSCVVNIFLFDDIMVFLETEPQRDCVKENLMKYPDEMRWTMPPH